MGGIVNFVSDTLGDIGDVVGGAVDNFLHNPIGGITAAIAMSYGIPPAWAGALGGAAGAAASGGDVVKAALTGAAMGEMGYQASDLAGAYVPAEYSQYAGGAAGGAAAGVTGAVLTGQNIQDAMKAGLILGTVMVAGQKTYQFMTKDEAIASVPDEVRQEANNIANEGGDAANYINEKMGWTTSDSSLQAADQAHIEYLNENKSVPDLITQKGETLASNGTHYTNQEWNQDLASALDSENPLETLTKSLKDQGYGKQSASLANTMLKDPNFQWMRDYAENTPYVVGKADISELPKWAAWDPSAVPVKLSDGSVGVYYPNYDEVLSANKTFIETGNFPDQFKTPTNQNQATTQNATVDYSVNGIVDSTGTKYDYQHFSDGTHTYTNLTTGEVSHAGLPTTTVAQPVQPPNTVDVGNGNYMDQQGNIVDSQGNITQAAVTPSNPIQQTSSGYTPEQEARYNELLKGGMTPADAVRQIETPGTTTSDTIPITGSAGLKGNETVVVPEYRTPNTDLATQEQIDNGSAKYNSSANAWEVPLQQEQQPIIPVVPPVNDNIDVGGGYNAGTGTNDNQPVVPTQPTQPTVVSSSTRTTYDGSVYQDNQLSDGTTQTTLISGPVSTTGQVSSGGSTNTNLPLTPPTQVVIPDGSSYVAPVDVTTPNVPVDEIPHHDETPTEEPTDTTSPYVPILSPVTPTPTDGTHYGTFKIGEIPYIKPMSGLNSGFITNVPQHYQTTNPAQSQYYWGQHPFQTGTTFNPTLYNQTPNAPSTPFGLGYAQGPASGQQIINQMRGVYPLLNTVGVTGPVAP